MPIAPLRLIRAVIIYSRESIPLGAQDQAQDWRYPARIMTGQRTVRACAGNNLSKAETAHYTLLGGRWTRRQPLSLEKS